MSESNKDEKKHLDNTVKSKIKGLGLEALFHQVDLSTKDKTPYTDQLKNEAPASKKNQHSKSNSLRLTNPFEEKIKQFNTKVINKHFKTFIHVFVDRASVRCVIYQNTDGVHKLIDSLYVQAPYTIADNEAKYVEFAKSKIEEKFKTLNDPHPVITSFIPRNKAIIKTISVPTHDAREIERMIKFEAEHQFAIPTHQLCYDYAISAQTDKSTEIILAAVKTNAIDEHIALLKSLNLTPTSINLSALGLFNAPNNYALDNHIQINLDHNFIDINLIENGSLTFTRGLHWGTSEITNTIAKEHNINSDVAFKMQNDNGIVSENPDEQKMIHKVSNLIKNWADNIITEIHTTLDDHNTKIKTVTITGPGSHIKNLTQYIDSKLNIHTSTFNDQPDLKVHSQELSFLTQSLHNQADKTPLILNLAPTKIIANHQNKQKRILQFAYAKVFLLLIAALYFIPQGLLFTQKQYLHQLDKKLTQLEPQVNIIQEERKKLQSFEDYISPKQSSLEILRELSLIVTGDIIIQSYTFLKNDYVTLVGLGGSNSSVVNLTKSIRESKQFKQATLKYIKRINREQTDVNFEIICKLN